MFNGSLGLSQDSNFVFLGGLELMSAVEPLIDLVMCVGPRDVNYLMPYSLQSCLTNFELLKNVTIVTSAKAEVQSILKQHQIRSSNVKINILEDQEVLPPALRDWPGWCKQQFIRLHADKICETPIVACLSADTLIFKPLTKRNLFFGPTPILFYNRYPSTLNHLFYERKRVENVASILRVRPTKSWLLGDFIMDFMLFESSHLYKLRRYLEAIYGKEPFLQILPKQCDTEEQRVTFGEWTLYAVFLLDVLNIKVPVQNSMNRFIAQVHSSKDFAGFHFDAHVVHFVAKTFDIDRILTELKRIQRPMDPDR